MKNEFDAVKMDREFKKLPKSTLFLFSPESHFKYYTAELMKLMNCDRMDAKLYLALSLGVFPIAWEVDARLGEEEFHQSIIAKHSLTNEGLVLASQIIEKAHLYQMLLIYKDKLPIANTIQTLKDKYPIYRNVSITTASQLAIAKLSISFLEAEKSLNNLLNQTKQNI